MDTAPPKIRNRPSAARSFCLLVAALLGIWFCSLLGPLSILLPIVGIAALVYFLRNHRFVFAFVFVLATPLSFSFLWGIVDYVNGNARLRHSGLPATEFHNLDPELRCGRVTYGCLVRGNEWITQTPYNCAVRLLTACCGWMPNTYDGPYPNKTDAIDATTNGSPVSIRQLRNGQFVVGGVSIQLDDGVGAELLERLGNGEDFQGKPPSEITATVWQQECVVIRIPVWTYSEEDQPSAVIVLLSRSAGRPFAYYAVGEYSHHFPPVPWNRHPA